MLYLKRKIFIVEVFGLNKFLIFIIFKRIDFEIFLINCKELIEGLILLVYLLVCNYEVIKILFNVIVKRKVF